MQRFVAGDQQASDLEVKERQVKAASKNVVRDAIERDEKLQVHTLLGRQFIFTRNLTNNP